MEAYPAKVIDYFNGEKQNLIPLFQRPYIWGKEHWDRLWDDIIVQYEQDDGSVHFLGAIVSVPARTVPVGVSKYLIIDGQQRLTSISLLLCAIRDKIDSTNAERVQEVYLINKYRSPEETLKFLPTQIDRDDYREIVLERTIPNNDSHIVQAYKYFSSKLSKGKDSDDNPISIEKILSTIERALQAVMINLGDADDPYLIFESLNFKGQPLEQADLVRNYLLMKFRHEVSSGGEQERIYHNYWLPMENDLKTQLTEYLRFYIMKDGTKLRQDGIYTAVKGKFKSIPDESNQVEEEIKQIKYFADMYSLCLEPERESDTSIQELLRDFQELKSTTSYPLVLRLLDARARGVIDNETFGKCLRLIQSFLIRRSVCSVPTNALNKLFLQWTRNFTDENTYDWLLGAMKDGQGGSRFPTNTEFENAFINSAQYGKTSTKLILKKIEASFGHKEQVDLSDSTLSVEHVMPQTLTEEWENDIGEDFSDVHGRRLHTMGNLTLTGYNSTLSNNGFEQKKEVLRETHIEMNKYIARQEQWDEQAIISRANKLYEVAKTIWERPE